MKRIFFVLLLAIVGSGLFAQATDAQIRQAASTLGVPYEALKQFVDSYKTQDVPFIGFYASESGDAFEFRSKSECVYHFKNGSRQVCTYSIKNGIIEVVNSFGYIVPLKIIDNNTLERQDLSNKDLYRKR